MIDKKGHADVITLLRLFGRPKASYTCVAEQLQSDEIKAAGKN